MLVRICRCRLCRLHWLLYDSPAWLLHKSHTSLCISFVCCLLWCQAWREHNHGSFYQCVCWCSTGYATLHKGDNSDLMHTRQRKHSNKLYCVQGCVLATTHTCQMCQLCKTVVRYYAVLVTVSVLMPSICYNYWHVWLQELRKRFIADGSTATAFAVHPGKMIITCAWCVRMPEWSIQR